MSFLVWLAVASALSVALLKLYNKLTVGWCRSPVCLKGKTALVTGANTGIGYETALDLAKRGARVILACRSEKRAKEACDKIKKLTHNEDVVYRLVDLASFKSVKKFAEEINESESKLDVLVNNAGVGGVYELTEDGFQTVMQVNYYSAFLLTHLLLDLLKKTPSSRIVNVASIAAKYGKLNSYNLDGLANGTQIYFNSKLCLVLFTVELAKWLAGTNVTAYSLHPGVVATELFRNMPKVAEKALTFTFGYLFKDSLEGAQTSVYLSVADGIEEMSGEHFHDCQHYPKYPSARDDELARKVWQITEGFVKDFK